MYRQKSPVYASLCLLAICIVLVLASFLTACSSSGGDVQYSGNPVSSGDTGSSGDPNAMPPGTGSITFGVVWQQPSSGSNVHMLTPAFNSCVDYGIGTISATVSSGTTTITSTSWPCSLHQGAVIGVPAGSNYTLQVRAISSSTTLWSGQVSSITVNTGQQTNVGAIMMSYVGTDSIAPTVTTLGPNSNTANTTSVPVTDRLKIVFSESMEISTVTSTNITVSDINGPIAGNVSYDSASKTAAFIPSSNLAYNTQYTLQVLTGIKDLAGHPLSAGSSLTFTTEPAPSAAASAPAGLTAVAGNGQVKLDWLAVNGAETYNVYYSTSSPVSIATGTQLANVKAPSVNLGLANGQTLYYIVTAYSTSYGESPALAEASATPTVPAGNPAVPTNFSVTYNSGSALPNTMTWTAVSGMSYNLYWSTRPIYPDHNSADNVVRYVTPGSYTHTSVLQGVTYCYILTAMNSAGESADSMQVCGPGAGSILFTW
jgi:hypothetical protein